MEILLIIFGLSMDFAGAILIIRPIMNILFYKTRFQLEEDLEDLKATIRIMENPNSGYGVSDPEDTEHLENLKKNMSKLEIKILNIDKNKYETDRKIVQKGLGLIAGGFALQISAYIIQLVIQLTN